MEDRLTEAHEQHQELLKKLQTAEEVKKKMKYDLQQVQMKVNARVCVSDIYTCIYNK